MRTERGKDIGLYEQTSATVSQVGRRKTQRRVQGRQRVLVWQRSKFVDFVALMLYYLFAMVDN